MTQLAVDVEVEALGRVCFVPRLGRSATAIDSTISRAPTFPPPRSRGSSTIFCTSCEYRRVYMRRAAANVPPVGSTPLVQQMHSRFPDRAARGQASLTFCLRGEPLNQNFLPAPPTAPSFASDLYMRFDGLHGRRGNLVEHRSNPVQLRREASMDPASAEVFKSAYETAG